jgi:hypothetical protein
MQRLERQTVNPRPGQKIPNEYKLDKEQTSYNDILDAFRLSLQFYKRTTLS